MNWTDLTIPVGEGRISFSVPNLMQVVEPPLAPGVPDARSEIRRAVEHPIGCKRLRDIASGKHNAAIVVNDITRPYAGGQMVLEIARELNCGGIPDERIALIVAYGNHRRNTEQELLGMFGEEVCTRFRFVHHDANAPSSLKIVGRTDGGVLVEINREFAEADVKVTTGCIAPHQLAGFSGGRKSIIPGIAGINTLKAHHSFPIRPEKTSLGWLEGNPFHEEAMKAAYIAGVDFIVNSVDNEQRQMVRCVAGELTKAYMEGVSISRKVWSVPLKQKADVVIVSPGGYPRDFDLHQSQKAIGCAETLCRDGGQIILCAEMRDGSGKPGKVLREAGSPQEVIDRFKATGYTPDALSKAYMWARALQHYHISLLGSRIPREEQVSMFFEPYESIESAITASLDRYGQNASFLVIPCASEIIPVIE